MAELKQQNECFLAKIESWYDIAGGCQMTFSISPETEKALADLVTNGQFKTKDEALAEAIRLLQSQARNGDVSHGEVLPTDQWLEQFDRITKSLQGGNAQVDDSRESIYGDRGQ